MLIHKMHDVTILYYISWRLIDHNQEIFRLILVCYLSSNMLEDIRERVSRTLDLGPQIELSLDASRRFLSRHIDKKIRLVVLIIDIAGSTQLSLTMPTKVLARIIQLFSQEMGLVANRYGGYVLKYVGDSVITFFPAEFDIQKACMNAIAAAKEMQIIIDKCINPELEKRSYPKIRTKISINVGSDLIVLYGKSPISHIDIVGPTISVAAKVMLSAPPSSIIITEHVYNHLNIKELFKEIEQDNILLGDLKLYKANIKDTLEGY
ncbi:MAG: adenylate/guanylate cyclase domain-containing protein [Candidatus Nitrosothermus koennekii]|nr:MAG: adenylate/guanylate cyclase domain-containing protein [Candidatus Nitrosothermus koennekii]